MYIYIYILFVLFVRVGKHIESGLWSEISATQLPTSFLRLARRGITGTCVEQIARSGFAVGQSKCVCKYDICWSIYPT